MNEHKQEATAPAVARSKTADAFLRRILYDDVTQAYDATEIALRGAENHHDQELADHLVTARDALFAARLHLDPPADA